MKKLCIWLLCGLILPLCACAPRTMPEETSSGRTTQAAVEESTTGYFEMVWNWVCPEGKYSSYIDEVYHTECGSAGNAGKSAISAVAVLDLAKEFAGDDSHALAPFFETMNDSQARFFAAQWIRLNVLARDALRNPAQFRQTFGWAGLEGFDANLYSIQDLEVLNDVISSLLSRPEMN